MKAVAFLLREGVVNVFAIAAIVCFMLVVFEVDAGFSLLALGLAFVAVHLLVGFWPVAGTTPWRRPPA